MSFIYGFSYHFALYGITLLFSIFAASFYYFMPSSKPWLMPKVHGFVCWMLLGAARVKLEVHGKEHFDKMQDKSYLLISNHVTTMDPPILVHALKKYDLRYVYSLRAAHRIPFIGKWIGFAFNAMGWISIKHDDSEGTALKKVLNAGRRQQRQGIPLHMGMFPEGVRTYDGKISDFQDGAFYLSLMLGLPIIPVMLQGVYSVHQYQSLKINPGKIGVQILPPIEPPKLEKGHGNLRRQATQLHDEVEKMYKSVPNLNLDPNAYRKYKEDNPAN